MNSTPEVKNENIFENARICSVRITVVYTGQLVWLFSEALDSYFTFVINAFLKFCYIKVISFHG